MSIFNDCLEDLQKRHVDDDTGFGDRVDSRGPDTHAHMIGIVGASQTRFYERSGFVPLVAVVTCLAIIGIEATVRLLPLTDSDSVPNLDHATQVPAVSARPPFFVEPVLAAVPPHAATFTTLGPEAVSSRVFSGADRTAALDQANIAQLTEVDVESHSGFTRLRLHLSGERDYWVQGDAVDGEVEIVISDTNLSRAFSPQSFAGTGLSLRETHNTSIGLHLVLSFDEGSEVQSQFVADGSTTQLVLDVLEAPYARQAEASTPTKTEQSKSWGSIGHSKPVEDTSASEAFASVDRARELIAQNRPSEAIAEYIRTLSIDPDQHRAREHLVALLIESDQLNAADAHLAEGIERAPGHSEYTLLRAQLLIAMQQPQRAIVILESFPTPENRRSDALNLLAALYQQQGDHERAEALFRSAVRLAPHEGRLWMGLGISLEGQSRETEALAVYEQARSLSGLGAGPNSWLRSRIQKLTTVE